MTMRRLSRDEVHGLATRTLQAVGYGPRHVQAIADMLTTCQMDDCQSHGLFRLFMCAETTRTGRVDPQADPALTLDDSAVVRADAGGAISLLAVQAAMPHLVDRAKRFGVAALAVTRCYHFSALWPEVEQLTGHGLSALSMTPSHAWVAPAGGTRGALGTNPISFGWPRNGDPFVFDFATSAFARGEIELYRRENKPLPEGVALDANGQPTTDPEAAMDGAMCTFGSYKGSALSLMVELMAGPLIGDLTSLDSMAYAEGRPEAPYHGQILLAFDPDRLSGGAVADSDARAERLFAEIGGQGARLPSERRYAARARNAARGYVEISETLYQDLLALSS
ncbi:LDH2 family malate/lactate/ureidoglycolate dehydrogenase [Sagittula marina]|uniref:LDH2 family malate/lactate/ureidoglycolate dehydrogenase n=1 Tax=Sagittula marina TaxID=943940 RepID=A0A7W6DQL2_9RHOB|nr:Ldh family oxidoreductase [Sagittula marina]MBB3985901.1 LDH2 family malate/lactate/ureidoglycolate dehydrogenase [Sagittula marina]